MANRVKEDEKNERIIRGLLKLPENRRCINCNSLGPQYVCTNFWTFICTTCSGIHREFTHRVKSVSMAKFTSQEVTALQEGGNKRAKEVYLKEWDAQRNSFPDSSNVERLRDFIKHVYVDRRFSSERNQDKPPRVKMGEKEDFYENRRTDSYQGGSRSPPYEDNERRYSGKSSPGGRSYDGGRSPGYDQESRQYSDYRRSPARPEIVNDWRREDRFGNGRRFEERRMSDGDLKPEGRSPEQPKDPDSSSPPVVRPVREILGENTVPLRISEPPKPAARTADGSAHTQRTASSSSLGSANGNPVEVKLEPSGSLIDFDADPEPAVPAVTPPQQSTVVHSTPQQTNATNDNNWASFDAFPQAKVPQASNVSPLESVLSQLSVSDPAPAPTPISGPLGNAITTTTAVDNLSTFPLDGVSAAAPGLAQLLPVNGGNTLVNVPGATQWPNVQQQHSLFPAAVNQSTAQQFVQSVTGPSSNQPWNLSPAPNAQGFLSNSTAPAPSAFPKPAHEVNSVVASQPPASEVRSSGRKELPEDLFAFNYSAYRAPVPGWQTGPPGGMVYPMQYNTTMPIHTFQQSSKSTNPFDLSSELPVRAPTFPSMVPLQGALPNVLNPSGMPPSVMPPSGMPPSSMPPSVVPPSGMPSSGMPPSGLMRTSSLGAPPSAWMPQSPPYTSILPPHAPPYASAMPPRGPLGQQVPSNMPPFGNQGVGVAEGTAFGSLNADQQLGGRFSAPSTPTPFPSVGGNPFG